MPIYEYACDHCRRVFQFLVRSASGASKPKCPKCGKRGLRRLLSKFAVGGASVKSRPDEGDAGEPDDAGMERAMHRLEKEMAGIDENDPKQLGRFLRRMMEETGERPDEEMEETIRRLESGEDPEAIEESMGGDGGGGDYSYDDNLYDG